MGLYHLESLLWPSRRLARAWQWTAIMVICATQQGCLCGCSVPAHGNPTVAPPMVAQKPLHTSQEGARLRESESHMSP